jgi:hypothetical protein
VGWCGGEKGWDTDCRKDCRALDGPSALRVRVRGIAVEAEAASWAFICTASDDDDEGATVELALTWIA